MAEIPVIAGTRDMPLIPKKTSGRERVVLRLIRTLNTPRGSSCVDRNRGVDIADAIQETMTDADVARLRGVIKVELEKDDDVRTATVLATYSIQTKKLSLRISTVGPKVATVFTAEATSAAGVTLLEIVE